MRWDPRDRVCGSLVARGMAFEHGVSLHESIPVWCVRVPGSSTADSLVCSPIWVNGKDDPHGGAARKLVAKVLVHEAPPRMRSGMSHAEVKWGVAPAPRAAPVRRLAIENLHPTVIADASDLFVDGRHSQAILEACMPWRCEFEIRAGLTSRATGRGSAFGAGAHL